MGFADFFRNLFNRREPIDRVARYVIREHSRGRPLAQVLEDPYVRNRTTAEQRSRLVDNPEIVRAIARGDVESMTTTLGG